MRRLKNTRKLIEQEGVRIYGGLHFYLSWSKWLKLTKAFIYTLKEQRKHFTAKLSSMNLSIQYDSKE